MGCKAATQSNFSKLHFSNPQAYHDIYNNKNRWDKEWKLYHSFGEDRSSFGFITYKEAKERKDVLNRMFSSKAVEQSQGLVVEKVGICASKCNARREVDTSGNRSIHCARHSSAKAMPASPPTSSGPSAA